jgi:hypothetical protein
MPAAPLRVPEDGDQLLAARRLPLGRVQGHGLALLLRHHLLGHRSDRPGVDLMNLNSGEIFILDLHTDIVS